MTTQIKPRNILNLSASNVSDALIKDLRAAVAQLAKTTTAVTSIDATRKELDAKKIELRAKLQIALDDGDCEAMSKHTADLKRINGRLAENPVQKEQAFDEAVDVLAGLLAPVPATALVKTA